MSKEREIAYEPHPVSVERKAELIAAGYKIIDARFAPIEVDQSQDHEGKIELGTDSGDQISEDELRKIIEQETGKAPHPAAKYETLVARYNELNAKTAIGGG